MNLKSMRTLALRERYTPWLTAAMLYLFVAPNVDFFFELGWHDAQRIEQIVLLCIAGLGALIPVTGGPIRIAWLALPIWSRYTLGTALLLGLISCALASNPRWAILEWSTLVMTGLLALAVSASWQSPCSGRDRILTVSIYVFALIYCVKAVTMYLTMLIVGPEYSLGFSVEELFTGFSNVRFFGHIQTMLLPFLILPVIWWGKTNGRMAALFAVPAFWWMLVIASGTRGSWVALFIGAAIVVVSGGATGRMWCRWQVLALVGGACGYLLFVIFIPSLFSQPALFMHRGGDIMSLRGRDILWDLCRGLIAEHPWLGVGPMHFADRISELGAHPHNSLLQLLVEWGVPAAVLLFVVFVIGGLSWQRYVHRNSANLNQKSLILVALLAAIAGAAAQSMVDGVIVMPVSQVVIAVICGWALGCRFSHQSPGPDVARSGWLFRLAVIGSMAGILFRVLPEAGHLAERQSQHLIKQPEGPNPLLLPRYWLHGLIP